MSESKLLKRLSKARILKQLEKVENSLELYLGTFAGSDELEKALRLVRKMKKRLEK